MLLRNFPLKNARPRGAEQTRNYINALALKRSVDEVSTGFTGRNERAVDLDSSPDGVVLKNCRMETETFSGFDVTGVFSMEKNADKGTRSEPVFLRADVERYKRKTQTLIFEMRDDAAHYARQLEGSQSVEHLVHDLQTDTMSYFLRDEQGRFIGQ